MGEDNSELEKKGQGFSLEYLVYIIVVIIAVAALFAFFNSFNSLSNVPEIEKNDQDRLILNYTIELENGSVVFSGEDAFLLGYIGQALSLSDKIDSELENVSVGEEVVVELDVEDALGEYNEDLVVEINRTERVERRSEIDKLVTIPVLEFEQEFGESPELNLTVRFGDLPWDYKVVSIFNGEVVVSQEVEVGQIAEVNDLFFVRIAEVIGNKVVTMLTAENQTLDLDTGTLEVTTGPVYIELKLTPVIGERIILGNDVRPGKVLSYDSEKIVLDYNPDFVGEKLVFRARIIGN